MIDIEKFITEAEHNIIENSEEFKALTASEKIICLAGFRAGVKYSLHKNKISLGKIFEVDGDMYVITKPVSDEELKQVDVHGNVTRAIYPIN